MERYADTVLRVCSVLSNQRADAEDAFQETFIRYAKSDTDFSDEEHLKAWLIRVATNVCKDMLRRASSRVESLDMFEECPDGGNRADNLGLVGNSVAFSDPADVVATASVPTERADEGPPTGSRGGSATPNVMEALRLLDEKYRVPLFLKYYEGNTAVQIANTLGVPVNTVYTNIARGKARLREVLEHGAA